MELIPGVNSYMTLDEINDMVNMSFLSNSKEREYWGTLSDDDKCILVLNTMDIIDNTQMKYKGVKYSKSQSLQWPRLICQVQTDVPWAVKKGLILQMMSNSMSDLTAYNKLKRQGIKSFADGGGAKIEFANTSDGIGTVKNNNGIDKNIFDTYFKDWTILV